MAQTINTNIASLNAQRNLNKSQAGLATSLQRLSSGLRVNSAKDDAAGLAISSRMGTQIKGSAVAARNANDAISMAQTAEGALGNISDSLQRMRELAVQAATGSLTSSDRDTLNSEFSQLNAEITRVIDTTQFNGRNLLAGGLSQTIFQIGANVGDTITTSIAGLQSNALSIASATLAGSTGSAANSAMASIDAALTTINEQRAVLGATQNRFDAVIVGLQVNGENLSAAQSRIMDADFATETANLTRSQILQQAGTAMLAQANAVPQNVLSLLQ